MNRLASRFALAGLLVMTSSPARAKRDANRFIDASSRVELRSRLPAFWDRVKYGQKLN